MAESSRGQRAVGVRHRRCGEAPIALSGGLRERFPNVGNGLAAGFAKRATALGRADPDLETEPLPLQREGFRLQDLHDRRVEWRLQIDADPPNIVAPQPLAKPLHGVVDFVPTPVSRCFSDSQFDVLAGH